LKHLEPQLWIQIDRTSAQVEGIPRFLKDLNEMIARDPYLRRFRGKQETVQLLGSELKKAAQAHVSNLQEKFGPSAKPPRRAMITAALQNRLCPVFLEKSSPRNFLLGVKLEMV
jgi:hypothetical protein